MRRRTYLGLATASLLAGCLDLTEEESTDGDDGGDRTSDSPGGDDGTDDGDDGTDDGGGGTDDGGGGTDDRSDDDSENGDGGEAAMFDQRWSDQLDTEGTPLGHDIAIGDGAAFAGHDAGLAALELADGTQRWFREDWSEYTTVHADDRGLVVVADGEIVTLDSESGETAWSESVEGSLEGFARGGATSGVAIVSTDAGTAVYDRETGDRLSDFGGAGDVVTDGDTAVLTLSFEAVGIGPDGEELWRAETDISPGGAVADGILVGVDTGDLGEGTAIGQDATNGEVLWEEPIEHASTGFVEVGITDGVAVFVPDPAEDAADRIHAFDIQDGTELWTETLGSLDAHFQPPAVADGVVVAETAEDIRAFDAATGETLATMDRPFSIRAGVAGAETFIEWAGQDITAYHL